MDPLSIELPPWIDTPRLRLRSAREDDAPALNAAVAESLGALRPWMPWAQRAPTLAESRAVCRRQQGRFLLREDLTWLMFERASDGAEGALVGGCGLHRIDWTLRRFEVGYWRREPWGGRGLVGEAVQALARMAFDVLDARRVEVRMDARNVASRRVAERAGFAFEGLLRSDALDVDGRPRDTCVYARVRDEAAVSPTPG